MKNTARTRGKRALALLAAFALTGVGVLGAAAAANAAPSFGNIDPDADGSIIIHKHEHQTVTPPVEGNADGTGALITTPGVADVTFTVYELLYNGNPVDLTVPSAWDNLGDLVVSADGSTITGATGYTRGAVVGTGKTDASGLTKVDVSTIGAYVVVETAAPPTVTDTAAPFIVTIPFPYEDGWLYDVNVYPKNGTSTVEKTINPQDPNGVTLGSVVQFPVTVKVPSLAAGRDFTSFDVVDVLDPKLTPKPAAAGDAGAGVLSVVLDGTVVPASYYTVAVSGQNVSVTFDVSNAAVQTLLKGAATKNLVVTFQGVVNAVGEIVNDATGFINNPGHDSGITSNEVTTNWGDAKILKIDSATPSTPLAGAKFQVYNAEAPYAASCDAAVKTGSALSVGTADTFTTGADGVATIAGLFVSDSVNPTINAAQRCYVVVEIEAPAGFITPTGAAAEFPLTVKTGSTASGTYDLTVKNQQQDVPNLPLTGGSGTIALIVGGVGLLAVAGGLFLVRRRAAAKH